MDTMWPTAPAHGPRTIETARPATDHWFQVSVSRCAHGIRGANAIDDAVGASARVCAADADAGTEDELVDERRLEAAVVVP